MNHIIMLPILIPMLGAMIVLLSKSLSYKTQRSLSLVFMVLLVVASIFSLSSILDEGDFVYQMGNWQAPFGITFVLDKLSVTLVLLTSLLAFGALWYAVKSDSDKMGENFHTLFHLQVFGLNGAFLTGDLFNLFVFFEILLLASYALLLHGHGKRRARFGMHYMVINLVGSTIFLFAIGTLYGILGTLNIADLAFKISTLPAENTAVVATAGLLLLIVFGLKSAMFPLYFWLPGTYSSASAPVAALFAIMTKVGIYSIIRIHGTLFGELAGELSYYYTPWVLGLGLFTLVLATIGVMSSKALKEQVAYLVLASVSILLIAIGINTPAAISGAMYYLIHSTIIAGGFFLLADVIGRLRGNTRDILERTDRFKMMVLSGSLFFVYAIAAASMPPFSGFLGKMMILSASLASPWVLVIFAIVLVTGLGIIISLTRTGTLLFYHTKNEEEAIESTLDVSIFYPIMYLFALCVLLIVFANPISGFTEQVSLMIFDSQGYISKVLVEEGR